MGRLESHSNPVPAADQLCALGQVIAMIRLLMKMMVLALGGYILGDVMSVNSGSAASRSD